MNRVLIVALLFAAACKKEATAPPAPPPKAAAGPREPGPPPPGTDADRKLQAALALAKQTDDALATFTLVEKPLPTAEGKPQRKAKVWLSDKKPRKTTIVTLDDAGNAKEAVDIYYDDRGKPGFVRAPEDLFVFHEESLALLLDNQQRLKRGVTPQEATVRVDEIKKQSEAALAAAGAL